MQVRQPLRRIQFKVISQKLIKLESWKNVYPMVFMDRDWNKIYIIKVMKTYQHKICKLANKKYYRKSGFKQYLKDQST